MRSNGILLLAGALLALLPAAAAREVRCRVSYVAADGIFLDAGAAEGLAPGDTGRVLRGGAEIARIEIAAVSRRSCRANVIAQSGSSDPASGDDVEIDARGPLPEAGAGEPGKANGTARPPKPGEEPGFVPLLERQTPGARAKPRANVFHGWLSLDLLAQSGDEGYLSAALRSGGTVDHLAGSAWTLEWFGTLRGYGGDAFDGEDLEGASLSLYELAGRRRFADDSFLRVGRFSAEAVRALGTIDGAQYERPLSSSLRAGVVGGLQPDHDDLSPTVDEPTICPYVTIERGERRKNHYTGTFALVASAFDGEIDRVALALDQRVKAGDAFRAGVSAEIDLDVGAGVVREGTRLTRLDLWADVAITKRTWLHFGVDRFERLDNAAERFYLGADPLLYPEGDWSARVGLTQEIGEWFVVNVQASYLEPGEGEGTIHGYLAFTWRDAFRLAGASLTLSLYDLEGDDSSGFGGSLGGYFPLAGGRWSILPSVGARVSDFDSGDSTTVVDLRLEAIYRSNGRWSGRLAVGHSLGDFAEATRFEAGFEVRW